MIYIFRRLGTSSEWGASQSLQAVLARIGTQLQEADIINDLATPLSCLTVTSNDGSQWMITMLILPPGITPDIV